jgi:hypothetical protein
MGLSTGYPGNSWPGKMGFPMVSLFNQACCGSSRKITMEINEKESGTRFGYF